MSTRPPSDHDHLQKRQLRGLILLLSASAVLLAIALWRSYSPPAPADEIPQDVMEQFQRITAYSDTATAAGRSYSRNSAKEKNTKNKVKSKTKKNRASSSNAGPSAQPARDITKEDLSR